MAYENLKATIKQAIKQNDNQEITGPILQSTLLSMIDNIPEIVQESGEAEDKVMSQKAVSDKLSNLELNKATYCGYTGKSTIPVAKAGNFYIAYEVGTYENFGNLYIDGHFLYENGYYYIISQGFYLYKSNSLHGTFEIIRSIPNYEASFPIKLGNGKWRIFAQGAHGQLGNNKMYYLDTKGDSIESEWDEPKEIKVHYKDFNANLDGNNKLYPFHFTICDFINHQ